MQPKQFRGGRTQTATGKDRRKIRVLKRPTSVRIEKNVAVAVAAIGARQGFTLSHTVNVMLCKQLELPVPELNEYQIKMRGRVRKQGTTDRDAQIWLLIGPARKIINQIMHTRFTMKEVANKLLRQQIILET